MRQTIPFLVAFLGILASTVAARPAAEEGFAVGAAREVVIAGTVFDSAAGTPVAAAQVTVLSDYATERGTTGPDGSFRVSMTSAESMGTLSIEISAYGFQTKYVEALLRDTFRNRVDARVTGSRVSLKAKKFAAELECGGTAEVESRSGPASPVAAVCSDGLTGVEFNVRKNRVAVLATPPYALRVESGRVAILDLSGGRVEIRVDAAMLPR